MRRPFMTVRAAGAAFRGLRPGQRRPLGLAAPFPVEGRGERLPRRPRPALSRNQPAREAGRQAGSGRQGCGAGQGEPPSAGTRLPARPPARAAPPAEPSRGSRGQARGGSSSSRAEQPRGAKEESSPTQTPPKPPPPRGHGAQPPAQPQPQDLKMLSLISWLLGRVVVLSAAVSVATSITMSGEWGEEGATYGQLGTEVALDCAGGSPGAVPEWRWNGSPLLPEGSVVQHGRLLLPAAELSSQGVYSCHDASGLPLSSVTLRLGRLPGVPSVSCRASNSQNFSCFWTSSRDTFLPTRYITTYRRKLHPGDEERQRSPSNDVGLCLQDPASPHSCTVGKSHFWSSYRMNVTEVNPLGSSFRLLDFTVQAILKPDPPEGLRVEPVPLAPRQLRVSWENPSTWLSEPHFQLKFRLQYRPVKHSSWSMVETANVSELITDAFMGLEHVVQVSAKDFLDAGSWSEWSSEVRGTPALGQTLAPSKAATAAVEPESPAEEPSLAPNNEPVAGRSDPLEKVAVLVSLGVFAFFVLAVILAFALLMWIRMKKHSKEATKNHDLLSATIHMKALPKAQIL